MCFTRSLHPGKCHARTVVLLYNVLPERKRKAVKRELDIATHHIPLQGCLDIPRERDSSLFGVFGGVAENLHLPSP